MQYVNLGRTALKVSRLCLGTMNFGPQATEPDSHKIMDRALDLGINFFDTANVYGWKKGEGFTEQIIGRWFAQGDNRRERVVIATKVFGDMGRGNMLNWPNTDKLSALHIKRACEDSLHRLQTDYIDLYQMHHVWLEAGWDEIWQAMEQLVREGKVLYIGSSNFAAWHIVQANEAAKARHFLGLVSEQSKYSLLCRHIELEVLPACKAYGVGMIPWSPLAGGVLAGGMTRGAKEGRRTEKWATDSFAKHREQIERWETLCDKLGVNPADLALAWMLQNDAVTSPIIGPRTLDQLNGSLRALELKVTPEMNKQIDAIFPGPGGPAPQAYAW